jgi:hypothetical protein
MSLGWYAVTIVSVVAAVIGTLAPGEASAQGWAVDLSGGQVVYDPVSSSVGTATMIGTLRYTTERGEWVYGTLAPSLRETDPFWGAFGAGGRFVPATPERRRATVGLDVGAHGYVFNDGLIDRAGRGVMMEAFPFLGLANETAAVEIRAGWRGHAQTYLGAAQHRNVFETGARAAFGRTLRVLGETRFVHTADGNYPLLAATAVYTAPPLQLWVQWGRWMSTRLDDVLWGAGVHIAMGRGTLWASVRHEAPDPLYWNVPRRSWSVGMTRQLGARRRAGTPLAVEHSAGGAVTIRVPAGEAPGQPVSIAGDFTGWQPTAMHREEGHWVFRSRLARGVYHYAFHSGNDWFVPESTAGRRDDGMGGHVAVLVVD